MKLKKRIFIGVTIVVLAIIVMIHNPHTVYTYSRLETKIGKNFFDDTNTYLYSKSNAIVTKSEVSTGMYTDSNNVDYQVIFKINADDFLLKNGDAVIALESQLNSTTEWVVDNKYRIIMYYERLEEGDIERVIFYDKTWVGTHETVSVVKKIPMAASNAEIFVKYESRVGSVLGYKNGNDVRFINNYLSCW